MSIASVIIVSQSLPESYFFFWLRLTCSAGTKVFHHCLSLPRRPRSQACHAFLPTWVGMRDKPKNVCMGGYHCMCLASFWKVFQLWLKSVISQGHKPQQLLNKSGTRNIESHFLFAEINRCVVNNGGCHQNATCTVDITLPGFRSCMCNRDFTGDGLFCAGKCTLQTLLQVIRRCF